MLSSPELNHEIKINRQIKSTEFDSLIWCCNGYMIYVKTVAGVQEFNKIREFCLPPKDVDLDI